MFWSHLLLAFLWTLFSVLHSFLASPPVKTRIIGALRNNGKYYRLFYTLFALASLSGVLFYQFSLESLWILPRTVGRYFAGISLAITGLLIMLNCAKKYLFTVTGLQTIVSKHSLNVLETSGFHGIVRHPLYLGTIIFIIGLLCIFPLMANLVSVVLIIFYTIVGIRYEERKLVVEFGDAYKRYQEQVPMILPFR